MRPQTGAVDLQSVRALAHRLYCQCQEPLSAYKPVARSVRVLRNKLEEVDEAFGEANIRIEDTRALQAAVESRDLLNMLDRALQSYPSPPCEEGGPSEGHLADLLMQIDMNTRKLSSALEALELLTGKTDLMLSTPMRETPYHPASDSPTASTASSEHIIKMGNASTLRSFSPSRASISDKTSLTSDRVVIHSRPEEEKEAVWTPAVQLKLVSEERSSANTEETWRTPFAYPDPMSIDIAKASSMILGSERSATQDHPVVSASGITSNTLLAATPVKAEVEVIQVTGSKPVRGQSRESSKPSNRIDSGISYAGTNGPAVATATDTAQDPSHEWNREALNLADNEVPDSKEASGRHDDPRRSSETATLSELGSGQQQGRAAVGSVKQHANELRNSLRLALSDADPLTLKPSPHDDDQTTNTAGQSRAYMATPLRPPNQPPALPHQRHYEVRNRTVSRGPRAPESRYRVVNPDFEVARGAKCQHSEDTLAAPNGTPEYRQTQHSGAVFVSSTPSCGEATMPISTGSKMPSLPSLPVNDADVNSTGAIPEPLSYVEEGRTLVRNEQGLQSPVLQRPIPRSSRYRPSKREVQGTVAEGGDSTGADHIVSVDEDDAIPKGVFADQAVPNKGVDLDLRWQRRSRERTDLDSSLQPTTAVLRTSRPALAELGITELPGEPMASSDAAVEPEQALVQSIVQSWNAGLWDQAKDLIERLLNRQTERNDRPLVRRMRHLLGVIASLQGDWHRSLALFVDVFDAPISEASQLDAGHCAAAYWMGDAYALCNRRTEALLAYSITAQGLLSHGSIEPQMHQCVMADREACQLGGSRSELKLDWHREVQKRDSPATDSLLDPRVITSDAARSFFDYVPRQPNIELNKRYSPDPNDSRAIALCKSGFEPGSWQEKHRLQIDSTAFMHSGPWPVMFDPLFAMANVAHGRLLAHECDLLQTVGLRPTVKIPKNPGRTRMNSFTCQDLRWLILTLRQCLTKLEVRWTEVANAQGTWFVARYSSMEDKVATTHFFSIALFRLSFRSGYGVDICPSGISSARIRRSEPNVEKGVHQDKAKRVKKLVREYLDAAAQRQEAVDMKGTALPVMSINGITSLHRSVSSRTKKSDSTPASSRVPSRPESLLV
ncbi:hypothetical protein LTR85_009103 [Meristemomyces frigidus]|nr:hypothetical protein LTR85_009103 [Meristemomyces frigidus]